jgi:hypothetical protein
MGTSSCSHRSTGTLYITGTCTRYCRIQNVEELRSMHRITRIYCSTVLRNPNITVEAIDQLTHPTSIQTLNRAKMISPSASTFAQKHKLRLEPIDAPFHSLVQPKRYLTMNESSKASAASPSKVLTSQYLDKHSSKVRHERTRRDGGEGAQPS